MRDSASVTTILVVVEPESMPMNASCVPCDNGRRSRRQADMRICHVW